MRYAWFRRPAVRMVLLGVWFGAMMFVVVGGAALGVRPNPATWVALALVVSGVVLTVPDRPVLVLEVALFALIPSVVATVCFFAALRHLSAPLLAMILPLEVVLAILWSVLFLGEELRAVEAVGAAVVVSGVVLAQRFAQRPPPNHSIQASAEVGLNT